MVDKREAKSIGMLDEAMEATERLAQAEALRAVTCAKTVARFALTACAEITAEPQIRQEAAEDALKRRTRPRTRSAIPPKRSRITISRSLQRNTRQLTTS